jgi:dGTP triphosphohydrolase
MRDSEIRALKLRDDRAFVRAAIDHVAGMTDRFALREYDQLYSAYPREQL